MKEEEREADRSRPSGAEVGNAWSYAPTLPYVFAAWCLITGTTLLNLLTYLQGKGAGI